MKGWREQRAAARMLVAMELYFSGETSPELPTYIGGLVLDLRAALGPDILEYERREVTRELRISEPPRLTVLTAD